MTRRVLPPHRPRRPARARQRGATLIIGLIMLLLVTLLAVAGVRLSTTHVQVVANEQFRTEATTVANYALDLAINSTSFTSAAQLPQLNAVSLQQVTHAADSKALAVAYTAPQCQRYRYLKKSELTKKDANGNDVVNQTGDETCFSGTSSTGITIVDTSATTVDDNSLCVTTLWELGATVTDNQTGAAVTVNQGVEMRMEISEAENKCS